MASTTNVILGAAAALTLWTVIGLAVARAVIPARTLMSPLAPVLGWAVHSAATLPLFMLIGFNRLTVAIVTLLSLAAAAYALWRRPGSIDPDKAAIAVPYWAWLGAAVLALGPTAAILPKFADGAVVLSGPIFDHAKVAMIDEMVRLGLPPGNPFFGEAGQPSRLAYYYLLHFSAAELALLLGISGWEADAALTWFSAFTSLMLMIGFATWLGGRKIAALLVLLVCMTGSLRPLLAYIPRIDGVIVPQTGFAGWLFQSAWVPQHLASASCVVLAMLLLSELVRRESLALLAVFVLVVVAGATSSTWVGGVTFGIAAIWIAGVTLANAEPAQRLPLLGRFALAAIGAAVLAAPILYDQVTATGTRGGWPVAVQTYEVMGELLPPMLRQLLDMPAFWVILLVVELPAIYLTGVYAMLRLTGQLDPARRRVATILIHLAGASLAVSWLMVSTIGGNNDLGWRAVLPACLVLTVFAVAGLSQWIRTNRRHAAAGFVAIALALPSGISTLNYDIFGTRDPAGEAFAATPEMWAAVRRYAGPADRVGNNPMFLESMTPWPVNISWALLSNRRSCYAGYDLALPFIPLPRARLREIDAQFNRVFSGEGWPDDLRDLVSKYGCKVAVVTSLDGAWTRDPFATSPHWRLVESSSRGWRIYVAGEVAMAAR
jgi:hypothetical protein